MHRSYSSVRATAAVLGLVLLASCTASAAGADAPAHAVADPGARASAARPADAVVYGATSAGVVAAVRLAELGHDVVLVEPTGIVGGLSSCGLGATDIGNKAAIGGMSREFYRAVRAHYATDDAWSLQPRAQFRGRGHREGEDAAWTFEPHVAEAIFERWLAAHPDRITLLRDARIDLGDGAVLDDDGRLVALRLVDGRTVAGRVFLDCSYEGDLMAAAGVDFVVGREANAEFGETLNGVQTARAVHHQFDVDVDPYVVPGDPSSGLLYGIQAEAPPADGSGDEGLQAYCFRLCATDVPANRVPWPKPEGYDASRYELLLRHFEAGETRAPWHPVRMPNGKTDSNNNHAVSTDLIARNWDWATGTWEDRDRIFAEHLSWTQGLLWTLANHERVPLPIRAHFASFGLCRDEWPETGGWPPQVYVREGRRMRGAYVMTEHEVRGTRQVEDPIGLAAYGMDSHNVRRYVDERGFARNEGDVQVHGFSPYGISYLAIVPAEGQCPNLLVPVALSATHIAFGSIRMEPVFMVLAHSAAEAADLALAQAGAEGVRVGAVEYDVLRERLLEGGQVLRWTGPGPRVAPEGIDASALDGVVVDDTLASTVGSWIESDSVGPFVGRGYRHDGNGGKGNKSITFKLTVPGAGVYELQLAYTAHGNRARNVPVTLRRLGRDEPLAVGRVDQTAEPRVDGLFEPVAGGIRLCAGELVEVEVGTAGTEGYVVADAVRLVEAERDDEDGGRDGP